MVLLSHEVLVFSKINSLVFYEICESFVHKIFMNLHLNLLP